MSDTSIEWVKSADGSQGKTWNPVRGCSPISPGCKNCYAERMAGRFCQSGEPFNGFVQIGKNGDPGPHWTGKMELVPHMLEAPLKRKKPTTYFVNSMSDMFHEALPDEAIGRVFAVMALCPQHTFQCLTKRADRMRAYMADTYRRDSVEDAGGSIPGVCYANTQAGWPLPNVWLGVSVEDQEYADKRIPDLLATPAAIRFVSYEPALGAVDFTRIGPAHCTNALTGHGCCDVGGKLDWVIVGGESGPGARPFDIGWARNTIAQCKAAGVACFVKQLGARPYPGNLGNGRMPEMALKDRKGGDMEEWSPDLRVREMPKTALLSGVS